MAFVYAYILYIDDEDDDNDIGDTYRKDLFHFVCVHMPMCLLQTFSAEFLNEKICLYLSIVLLLCVSFNVLTAFIWMMEGKKGKLGSYDKQNNVWMRLNEEENKDERASEWMNEWLNERTKFRIYKKITHSAEHSSADAVVVLINWYMGYI